MIRTADQARLARYFNTGQMVRTDLLRGILSSGLPFRRNAPLAIDQHRKTKPVTPGATSETYQIPLYQSGHEAVAEIAAFLNHHLSDELAGAYVHGSLATNDYTPYSDFDGLLIVKDEVFDNPDRLARTAELISMSYSLMIRFDPLQHHGWFVLTEKDLHHFPVQYFPPVLFDFAASLLPHGREVSIRISHMEQSYAAQLKRLAASVIRKIENGSELKNMFTLKAFLSEFMLLPSLFMEARTGKGVYKKFSFGLASSHFSADEWSVMDEVSHIREQWIYKPAWTLRKSPVIISPYIRKIQACRAGPVPAEIQRILTPAFTGRMRNLAALFIEKGA